MGKARTYKSGTYYFDRDDEIIGRELSDKEIESLSHDQLVEAANGAWESNGLLYALPVLERPDGKLITYVVVDIYSQGGIPYEPQWVEVKEGEDPKTVFKRMYKD